jgi:hypothetical protein
MNKVIEKDLFLLGCNAVVFLQQVSSVSVKCSYIASVFRPESEIQYWKLSTTLRGVTTKKAVNLSPSHRIINLRVPPNATNFSSNSSIIGL